MSLAHLLELSRDDDRGEDTSDHDDVSNIEYDDTGDNRANDYPTDEQETPATADGELEIHHIDVRQVDATLLITAGETALTDTGDSDETTLTTPRRST